MSGCRAIRFAALRGRVLRRARAALVSAVLVTLLLSGAAPATGAAVASMDDYHDRVVEARMRAEDVLAMPDAGREGAAQLAGEIDALLGAPERVEVGDTVVAVDDPVVQGLTARLAAADGVAQRREAIQDLLGHLRSLEQATGTPGSPVPQDAEALKRLLAEETDSGRSAISHFFGDLVDRLGRALLGWWESMGGSPRTGRVLTIVTVVVLVALTLLLLWVIVRVWLTARRGTSRAPAGVAGIVTVPVVEAAEGLPDDPLAFADELAAAGDRRGALRALFGGAARLLAREGLVRGTRTHTNGELLAQVLATGGPVLHGTVESLCARFERAWYGHHAPGTDAFAAARDEYARIADLAKRTGDAA